jgi:hypothetical protein
MERDEEKNLRNSSNRANHVRKTPPPFFFLFTDAPKISPFLQNKNSESFVCPARPNGELCRSGKVPTRKANARNEEFLGVPAETKICTDCYFRFITFKVSPKKIPKKEKNAERKKLMTTDPEKTKKTEEERSAREERKGKEAKSQQDGKRAQKKKKKNLPPSFCLITCTPPGTWFEF